MEFIENGTAEKDIKNLLKQFHPDVCKDPKAQLATQKLIEYLSIVNNGYKTKDDIGLATTKDNSIQFNISSEYITKSKTVIEQLLGLKDPHLNYFLPKDALVDSDELKCMCHKRVVPLDIMQLEPEAVNWVVSRVLGFLTILHFYKYVHAGITPNALWIDPETHGVVFPSFYHAGKIGDKIKTISGKYSKFYPKHFLETKVLVPELDIQLAKKLAIYLYGNKMPKAFTKFFNSYAYKSSLDTYHEWRLLLETNFPKKFIKLNY
jgi:hypothetical protein